MFHDKKYLIIKGAVSPQSRSFCLILLITHPLSRYGTESKQRNYMFIMSPTMVAIFAAILDITKNEKSG